MVIHQPKFKKNYLRPKCRVDEVEQPKDDLDASRGILGVCGAMLVIFVVLFLLIWA